MQFEGRAWLAIDAHVRLAADEYSELQACGAFLSDIIIPPRSHAPTGTNVTNRDGVRQIRTATVNRRGAARWKDGGHPWIYRSDVVRPAEGAAGAVHVVDEGGGRVGTALWSPSSQIALRLLSREHVEPDAGFWRARVAAAVRYRESLSPDATAYRVVHAEADGLPSLVVDRFGDHLVVQMLSAGLEVFREEIVAALIDTCAPAGILARNDVPVRKLEQLPEDVALLYGSVPEELEVREGEVVYLAAPWTGQKTGAFLDQRENRVRAGALAQGRALDCFSYHGSFALHLAGRAEHVTAIDSSADALARARHNAALNGTRADRIDYVEANAFDYLREQDASREQYDTIILDPPAFAKRKDSIQAALRGYKELNLRALRILRPDGILCTFSCSYHMSTWLFREMLESAAADAGRPVRWIEWRGQASDHPEIVQIPESSYLKGAVLQVV
ncbi:MAG: class I SAM-dependent rRNA methyltransferase [Gemmatimonadetes bacterium]|nr:class I SAM-dependent rRNA methyltransferase [Gemmatimonadota bacterium]